MTIIASFVLRNEADRYLESCLEWNSQWWDRLFVYDDQSTDDTRDICGQYTDTIISRPDDVPSFMEHEGRYRSAAWAAMIDCCNPSEDDWIFAVDADEFLVGAEEGVDLRAEVRCATVGATMHGASSVELAIPDVWAPETRIRKTGIRTDGFWGGMSRPELIRFNPIWEFRPKSMGCGSGPTYSFQAPFRTERLSLLHYGHAAPADRQERYDRYMSLPDHGHNPKHIASIVKGATLDEWSGQVPTVWRGR